MMKSDALVLFGSRPKLGGKAVFPLSGGRVALLEDLGNGLFGGDAGESVTVSRFELFEVMMVCVLSEDELVEAMGMDEGAWKREVNRFSLGPYGDRVEEFGELLRLELEAIQNRVTRPKKKAARKRARK